MESIKKTKKFLKAAISIAVALALITPGLTVIANKDLTTLTSENSDEQNALYNGDTAVIKTLQLDENRYWFHPDDMEGNPGDDVEIRLMMEVNDSLTLQAYGFRFFYDSSALNFTLNDCDTGPGNGCAFDWTGTAAITGNLFIRVIGYDESLEEVGGTAAAIGCSPGVSPGEWVAIYIYMHVKEDALPGFYDLDLTVGDMTDCNGVDIQNVNLYDGTFRVLGNLPPVVDDIPDQSILEGGIFTPIPLDDYVDDPDNADDEIDWTYSGNVELTVDIDVNRVATINLPYPDWVGSETITFTATDPGALSDSDDATFTVTSVNDPPVVGDIPDQTILEGESFAPIPLDDYVDDPDNTDDEIDWTYSGNVELTVDIDVNRVATIDVPYPEWSGQETITFTATDPGALSDSDDATFTVTGVSDPPVVDDIPDQTILEGGSFATIPLDDYVDDPDNADDEMTWTYAGNVDLTVDIDVNRVATIGIPDLEWNGQETITFTATDPSFLSDSDDATFTVTAVNDAPDQPNTPEPADGATNINLNPTLSVYLYDIDGDAMDVYFYDASDDSLIDMEAGVASGDRGSVRWNGLAVNTTYSWYAVADDSLLTTQSATWSFTTTATAGWYYKPPYLNYAPSGMPDFSQMQNGWKSIVDGGNGIAETAAAGDDVQVVPVGNTVDHNVIVAPGPNYQLDTVQAGDDIAEWTFCGPAAVANCFWWFDSKYADPSGVPGDGDDIFPLVQDYSAGDDHASSNAPLLIEQLADAMQTTSKGTTNIVDMQNGIDQWFIDTGLSEMFTETTFNQPTFDFIISEVEKSKDVILLLGFYECGEKEDDQRQTSWDNYRDLPDWDPGHIQSFRPTVDVLDAVEILLGGNPGFLTEIEVCIYDLLPGDPGIQPIGCSQMTIDPPPLGTPGWFQFHFEPIGLTPGEEYYIAVKEISGDGAVQWFYDFNDVYPEGSSWLCPAPNDIVTADGDFAFITEYYPCQWKKAHYVTTAGVNSQESQIAISDPIMDVDDPSPDDHNDAQYVSHDIYDVATGSPRPNINYNWWLPDYPSGNDFAIVEQAVVITKKTMVYITPSSLIVGQGDTFTVDVFVEPGEPINGVTFGTLSFDSNLLQANSVTEGPLFDEAPATFFSSGTIDNIAGEINDVYGLTLPGTYTVTIPGVFCTISFTSQSLSGISPLDLIDVQVSNELADPVQTTVDDGSVEVDASAPTITDYSPSSGTTGDPYTFYALVVDNYDPADDIIVMVNWLHDGLGGNVPMTHVGGNYFERTVNLDHSILDMSYTIYAEDTNGNSVTTPIVYVPVLDNDPPVLTSDNTPSSGTTGEPITFQVNANDNIGVEHVYVYWRKVGDPTYTQQEMTNGGTYTYTMIIDPNDDTDLEYYFEAVDAVPNYGNMYSAGIPATIVITDNDPPVLSNDNTPSSGTTGDPLTFQVDANDNIGVEHVYVYWRKVGDPTYTQHEMIGSGTYTYTIIVDPFDNTNLQYYFEATDAVPNYGYLYSDVAPAMILILDDDPPVITDVTITMSDPIDTEPGFGWEEISCTIVDNIAVHRAYLIVTDPDNVTTFYLMNNIPATDTYYYTDTFTIVGTYSFYIKAYDTLNNYGLSTTEYFDLPPNWDINMDGICDILDMVQVSTEYGNTGPLGWIREDVNNDGEVGFFDLVEVSIHYEEIWYPPMAKSYINGDETVVSINPSSLVVGPGEIFSVDVYVEPSESINALSFELSYDPNLIQADSITEGDLLSNAPETFFNTNTIIDNVEGRITKVYGLTVPATYTVSSSGVFCTISFTAQQEHTGISAITIENVKVVNEAVELVPVITTSGSITLDSLERSFKRGDSNDDNTISMNDAIFLINYLYVPASESPTCMDSADVNDDGTLTLSDSIYLLQYLYVPGSPDPPAPGPIVCGPDLTYDNLGCNCQSSCMGCVP